MLRKDIYSKFVNIYSNQDLLKAYQEFTWQRKGVKESIKIRNDLAREFQNWAKNGFEYSIAENQIQKVHDWGFGRPLSAKLLNSENLKTIIKMLKTWYFSSADVELRATLIQSLLIKGIKIARQSKWICFLDQSKFGIYDSRVSLALRKVEIDGKRIFPTVGRRTTKNKKYPQSTYLGNTTVKQAERMSKCYINYIKLLEDIVQNSNFKKAADIEMALFMLGNNKKNW